MYERDQLHLRALQDAVRRGETITFEIEHTGRSETISLGCHIPWALQAYQNDQWRHVTWTEGRYYLLCYTGLSPGETVTKSVPLSRSALAKNPEVGEVVMEISPGKYRFLLVGALPNLAVNFRVLPTEQSGQALLKSYCLDNFPAGTAVSQNCVLNGSTWSLSEEFNAKVGS